MPLKFMWGFEIGAGPDYYANAGWGIPRAQATGSNYALIDTQYYEAHQPPTEVGGGLRCLKQTSYFQHWTRFTGAPGNASGNGLQALHGAYSEITIPVTGTANVESAWSNGVIHFSFKHDFDFSVDLAGLNENEGKWIHLCTLGSSSFSGSYGPNGNTLTRFEDGCLVAGSSQQWGDMWMPLPRPFSAGGVTPAGISYCRQGWRPKEGYISLYLVRQETAGQASVIPSEGGGPCWEDGDQLVAVAYPRNGCGEPLRLCSSSIGGVQQSVNIEPNVWTKFAIQYVSSRAPAGLLKVWQNGTLILDDTGLDFRQNALDRWNTITFSPFGRYVCRDSDGFPGGVWPEYSNLIDHLFVFGNASNADITMATSSLFIQGLSPDGDHRLGNFVNDTGFVTPNLFSYVNDPGDPNELEVSYISSPVTLPTSCSFTVLNPDEVTNGALSWSDYGPQIDQFVAVSAIDAVTKSGSGGSTNYNGSALLGRAALQEIYGSASLITSDRLLWVTSTTAIGTSSPWSLVNVAAAKSGLKVEPD